MAEIYAKSLTFPGLNNTYLFEQVLHGTGAPLENGENIDEIKTIGKYLSGSMSETETLLGDVPVRTGFTMIVFSGYIDGRVYQYIFPNENTVYRRYFNGSAWSSWTADGQILKITTGSYGSTLPLAGDEGEVFFKLT